MAFPPEREHGRLLLASNRLPISAAWRNGQWQLKRSSGGLATGLDRVGGRERLWFGWHGSRAAAASPDRDAELAARLQEHGLVPVPLAASEVANYYDRFANAVLWPLFHYLVDRIPADSGDWNIYRVVNERFADRIAACWRPGDIIWIHDYHLMLVPAMLRARLASARIGFFLHIPFPASDVFRLVPGREALLRGLLGADVIGFHTRSYVRHFVDALRDVLRLDAESGATRWDGRGVRIDAFPMGIDDQHYAGLATSPDVVARAEAIRSEAKDRRILLGVDRMDYTKGIFRRLMSFQRLLESRPDLRDRVRFIQIAVPSRIDVHAYREYRTQLDELIGHVNGTFGTIDAVPIHYLNRSFSARELTALYRAADVMVVTPLRDGMNLVAKEFIASRTDEDGVLLLSEFAGAAAELGEALIVNPYDVEGVAAAMARALALDPAERQTRMIALRKAVAASNVACWAGTFLDLLAEPAAGADRAPSAAAASREEDADAIVRGQLPAHRRVVLLLDYDGTLVPFAPTPDAARPDAELLNLLAALGAHPSIDLHLVTGRSIETANRWFWHLSAALWAEHGAAYRLQCDGTWHRVAAGDAALLERVVAQMERAVRDTPEAVVERKTTAAAWHYRRVDAARAAEAAAALRRVLEPLVAGSELELLEGHRVIEVRPRNATKRRVAEQIAREAGASALVVAIGDDQTDEQMFEAIAPPGVTVRVGGGQTAARYHLPDPSAVRAFLARLLGTGPKQRDGRPFRLSASQAHG